MISFKPSFMMLIFVVPLFGCRDHQDSPPDTAHQATIAPASTAVHRDSAGFFDPDGYYILQGGLKIDGRDVSWIDLHTIDYYYEGELHYDRPKSVLPPDIHIVFSGPGLEGRSRYPCTAPVISPDSLSVRCIATSIGDVSVDGHFLDKAGKYWNNPAYEEGETLLLIARVIVTKNGVTSHDAVHQFSYTGGD